jgi:putative chitinase
MPVTAPQMSQIFVHCAQPDAWVAALNPAMNDFDITTPARTAAFLSQIAYESGEFNHLLENLNYSAQRLVQVWPSRFPTLPVAIPYAGNPEKLANYIYANRLGNGPPESGDGWKYRGRGLIQLTGRGNYQQAATGIGRPLVDQPDLLLQPEVAARSAAFFWKSHGLNELADDRSGDDDNADFQLITIRINGGTNGLDGRRAYWAQAKNALGVA